MSSCVQTFGLIYAGLFLFICFGLIWSELLYRSYFWDSKTNVWFQTKVYSKKSEFWAISHQVNQVLYPVQQQI